MDIYNNFINTIIFEFSKYLILSDMKILIAIFKSHNIDFLKFFRILNIVARRELIGRVCIQRLGPSRRCASE